MRKSAKTIVGNILSTLLIGLMWVVSASATATSEVTIYGSVLSSLAWNGDMAGLYSFSTSQEKGFTPIKVCSGLSAQGGGVMKDNKYYSLHADDKTLHIYDIDTWEELSSRSMSNMTLDMTVDPTSGDIYGCFVDNGAQLGILLPDEGSYKKIAKLNVVLSALFCTADGTMYGIGSDGFLYKIDKSTGAMDKVGDTGFTPQFAQSATIDPNTGRCYWAAMDPNFYSGLYEVDLETGNATLLYSFENGEEVTGLYILDNVKDGAPGKITDFKADFQNGNTSGTVSFTMPNKCQDGSSLIGTLEYQLEIDNDTTIGTARAGEKVTLDRSLATGRHKFVVSAKNTAGLSERAVLSEWIGLDTPMTVTDVQAKKTSNTMVELSWTAPKAGVNDGYVDLSNISYTIVRQPDNQKLSSNSTATSLTDNINTTTLSRYWYEVKATSGGMTSSEAKSNNVVMGPAKDIPYTEEFASSDQFELYTIFDNNHDDLGWSHNASETAQFAGTKDTQADDWLITPPLKLDNESYYKLTFSLMCSTQDKQRLEVAIGSLPDAESMQTSILDATEYTSPFAWQTIETKFYVDNSADKYIGFHVISDINAASFDLDNIKLEKVASIEAPAKPTKIDITPAKNGQLKATIAITTPTTTINGAELSSITSVELYRGETLIKTFSDGFKPGSVLSADDNEPTNGFNTYKAIAYNDKGKGDEATQEAYIGIDIPAAVSNIKVSEPSDGIVQLTWDAPTVGKNGGYIDASELTYTVKRNGDLVVATDIKELTATDSILSPNDAQRTVAYTVSATSQAGTGSEGESEFIAVGKPYETPFQESFPDGVATYSDWTTLPAGATSVWNIGSYSMIYAQDNDGGFISQVSIEETNQQDIRLMSPKVRIDNTVKPVLEFYTYNSAIDDYMTVEIYNEQGDAESVYDIELQDASSEWIKHRIDLSDYVDQHYIRIGFLTHNIMKDQALYIDNIQVIDDLAHNLQATSINVPVKINVGDSKTISATVTNIGTEKAVNYTVDFYKNDELFGTAQGTDLAPHESATVGVLLTPQINDLYEASIYAIVNYTDDENNNNNTTETKLLPIGAPNYPTATNLSGRGDGSKITLSWTAPNLSNIAPEAVTEDFESYESFTISDLGDWTLVDNDKNDFTMEFKNGDGEWITYPHSGYGMSFELIDLTQIKATAEDGWTSASGNKFLLSPYTMGGNDDWLISPELYRTEQVISIYAKSLNYSNNGLEQYTVLYSTTDKDLSSFTELATVTDIPTEWTEQTFLLPAEAKYFAVHTTAVESALFVDDITYIPANSKAEELNLLGYNVYRDRQKLNSDVLTSTTYVDADVETTREYTYAVTAVYDKGESDYSNTLTISSLDGIKTLTDSKAKITLMPQQIVISGACGETIRISSLSGVSLICKPIDGTTSIPVQPGCYIISINNKSQKVMVR